MTLVNLQSTALGLFSLICAAPAAAQYFYLGIGGQISVYQPASANRIYDLGTSSTFASFEAAPFAGYRVGRRFAVGLSAKIPLISSNRLTFLNGGYNYNDAEVVGEYADGREFEGWSYADQAASRAPDEMGIALGAATQYAAHAMLILADRPGFFIEARAVYGGLRERFYFHRESSPGVKELSEVVVARKAGVYPGIGVGIMPHVSDHFFIRFGGGLDFVRLNASSGFRYQMKSQPDNGPEQTLTLRSDLKNGLALHIGFTFGWRL